MIRVRRLSFPRKRESRKHRHTNKLRAFQAVTAAFSESCDSRLRGAKRQKRSPPTGGNAGRTRSCSASVGWAVPSLFYRSPRRRTVICASAAVRAHPRRVCEGDLPLFANSRRVERPAGCPTGTDPVEQTTGGTAGSAATEGPPHAFSGVEDSGKPSEDRSSSFSAIGPKR